MDCKSCGKAIKMPPVICARCRKIYCQGCAIEHSCKKG